MSMISQISPNPINVNYNQQISATISICFIMQDSISASGQDANGMAIPGKNIFAEFQIQSPIYNKPPTRASQILVGGNIQILPTTTYTLTQAQSLWNTYISPNSGSATVDLNTKIITVPYP